MDWFSLALAIAWLVIGALYVARRHDFAARSGRGTALRLSPGGHLALGVLFLVLGAVSLARAF